MPETHHRPERCNETIDPKIGIVGIGNMGRIHARILYSQRALAGLTDIDMQLANSVAKEYDVPAFTTYQEMIENLQLDGVIIATPTPTHASIATDIANRYDIKGLLIEKPLASTLKDGQRVASILKKKGINTVVSHSEIYNPVVERALTLIREGAIGEPRVIIHDRRGFVQKDRIPALGDVFEDIGVHDFDIMSRISKGPAKLYAQCNDVDGVYNEGTVMIKFKAGTQHFFQLSRQYVGRKRVMDVSGSKGALVLDLFGQIIKVQDLDQEPHADSRTIKLSERGATIKVYGEPVGEVITDFIRCIVSGTKPRVSLEDGISALQVVEAARESTSTGRVVDIEIKNYH